jgi:hypothetical protein
MRYSEASNKGKGVGIHKIMKKLIFILLALLPSAAVTAQQDAEKQLMSAMHSVSSHDLLNYVTEICNDKYEGRLKWVSLLQERKVRGFSGSISHIPWFTPDAVSHFRFHLKEEAHYRNSTGILMNSCPVQHRETEK